MLKAKTTKKMTTTKKNSTPKNKKIEKVVVEESVPETEPDSSLWKENGFRSEKAYRKFLQPNS